MLPLKKKTQIRPLRRLNIRRTSLSRTEFLSEKAGKKSKRTKKRPVKLKIAGVTQNTEATALKIALKTFMRCGN